MKCASVVLQYSVSATNNHLYFANTTWPGPRAPWPHWGRWPTRTGHDIKYCTRGGSTSTYVRQREWVVGEQSHGMLGHRKEHKTDQRDEVTLASRQAARRCYNKTKQHRVRVSFKVTAGVTACVMRYGHGNANWYQVWFRKGGLSSTKNKYGFLHIALLVNMYSKK